MAQGVILEEKKKGQCIPEDLDDDGIPDDSELGENDITGPAGMGINNVILSFA